MSGRIIYWYELVEALLIAFTLKSHPPFFLLEYLKIGASKVRFCEYYS